MSAIPKPPTLRSQHPSVTPPDTPLLVAVSDAARLLGIGTTLAWDLVRSGDIPSIKLGRRVLVPRVALESLAHSHVSGIDQRPAADMGAPHPPNPGFYHDDAQFGPSPSGLTRPR